MYDLVLHKFVKRIFEKDGWNNEVHVLQNYIHSWLEKKLAQCILKDERFSSLEVLKSLLNETEMLDNFYNYLIQCIPQKWIKDKWTEIDTSPDKIIDSAIYHREILNNNENSLTRFSIGNVWNFVQESTRDSDYMMLRNEFSFLSRVLFNKSASLWIEFWNSLKLPVIQDCTLTSSNFTPKEYLQIIVALIDVKEEDTGTKILLYILVQNYFKTSYRLTEKLSLYKNSERKNEINKDFFQEGNNEQRKWQTIKRKNYQKIIHSLNDVFTNSEIEDWIFSYQPRPNTDHYKPNENYNKEIALLIDSYKKSPSDISNADTDSN